VPDVIEKSVRGLDAKLQRAKEVDPLLVAAILVMFT
jgi:hypothetical protein